MIKTIANKNDRVKKGLFLCFEGIGSTIFDSQIAVHARDMKEKGIKLEIWAFETWPGRYMKSKKRLHFVTQMSGCKISLFRGVFVYLPFSRVLNALLLMFHLLRRTPKIQFVHARTDYAATVCGYISFIVRKPIIWDCRGDEEAEFDFAYNAKNILQKFCKYIYLYIIRYTEFFAAKVCTKAIFVSQELFNRKRRHLKTNKTHKIIPCVASRELFFFSEHLRYCTRQELGYEISDIVLIYSGGMSKWEAFSKYVEMFRKIYDQNERYRLLIITPNIERAMSDLKILRPESYKIMSARFTKMNALYNAADFGCLLRNKHILNYVASPVKFSELCLAGLPVIMNESVKQAYDIANELENIISYRSDITSLHLLKKKDDERADLSKRASVIFSRSAFLESYIDLYS